LTRTSIIATPKSADPISSSGIARARRQRGFSLMELLISVLVLVSVISLAFDQIIQLQKKAAVESSRVDMSQDAREFIDRTVRDLHLAGYPSASMFVPPAANIDPNTNPWVAAGIVRVSPTQLLLEGDVNNDGQVYSVNIAYVAADPNDPNCPCIRTTATPKVVGSPLAQNVSLNYVETAHVMPPGNAPGQSGEDLFAYYDSNGVPVDITTSAVNGVVDISTPAATPTGPTGQQIISSIATVKVNLTLLATASDASGTPIRTSLSSTVRLNK